MQRACSRQCFHLCDHDTAGVFDSLCDRQHFHVQPFFFKRQVSFFISHRSADQTNINRESRVEQPFFVFDFNDFDDIFGRARGEPAAFQTRINECAHADFSEQARTFCGDFTVQLGDDPLRKVVGFAFVFDDQITDLR